MKEVYRVRRGGSWLFGPRARVADRYRWFTPDRRSYLLGLRLGRSPLKRMAR